jgi:hypothetical protein
MSKEWTGNFRSVVGCLGASNHSNSEREENDFYATDPIAAEWLIKLENLDNNIWECACGQGHLAKVFENHGYNVLATDLIERGYGRSGVDFLKTDGIFYGDIVTNPPYKYAQEFIEHALRLVPDGNKVCMFLKVQFLEGKGRRLLYANTPPCRVYVSSSRIACIKNGSEVCNAIQAYAWYVWQKGYNGDTILKWFN